MVCSPSLVHHSRGGHRPPRDRLKVESTKLDLAQFRELQAFAQFGSDLDEGTKAKIERGQRIVELFKQNQYNPFSLEMQVATMWSMQNGYLDNIEVDQVKDFQAKLEEYLTTRKESLLADIAKEKALTDGIVSGLKSALDDFSKSYK